MDLNGAYIFVLIPYQTGKNTKQNNPTNQPLISDLHYFLLLIFLYGNLSKCKSFRIKNTTKKNK